MPCREKNSTWGEVLSKNYFGGVLAIWKLLQSFLLPKIK